MKSKTRVITQPPIQRSSMVYRSGSKKNKSMNEHFQQMLLWRRLIFFTPVLVSSYFFTATLITILTPQGLTPLRWAIIAVFTFLSSWISINFWTGIFGFFMALSRNNSFAETPTVPGLWHGVRIAIVMPVYNEDTSRIYAAFKAMYESLKKIKAIDYFDFFILSDSTNEAQAMTEMTTWETLCIELEAKGKIFYRRRKVRIHKKSGNISDFCRRWGSIYKYMIPCDADSLIGAKTLVQMVNIMEQHTHIGILQTAPLAMNQTSLIARLQQFACHVYGPIFFSGLRFWQMDESGFWGHNAIVRMDPFIKFCALPRLSGNPPFGGEILSHDFVEAALMRKAGWGVCLAHELQDSYEELPPNLLEELERDRRWCQGNIQHLRLMFMDGIAFGHRILFLNGNLFYFSSFLWSLLLILMTVNAIGIYFQQTIYFPSERVLFPQWTLQYRALSLQLLLFTGIFLITHKILSIILIGLSRQRSAEFGGIKRVILSVIIETILSSLLAPMRMVFHSWYVILNLIGQKLIWKTQSRHHRKTSFKDAFSAHWVGTFCALIWAFITFVVSKTLFFWVSTIVIPLLLAVPISMIFSYTSLGSLFKRAGLLLTPSEIQPSPILARYQHLYKPKNV